MNSLFCITAVVSPGYKRALFSVHVRRWRHHNQLKKDRVFQLTGLADDALILEANASILGIKAKAQWSEPNRFYFMAFETGLVFWISRSTTAADYIPCCLLGIRSLFVPRHHVRNIYIRGITCVIHTYIYIEREREIRGRGEEQGDLLTYWFCTSLENRNKISIHWPQVNFPIFPHFCRAVICIQTSFADVREHSRRSPDFQNGWSHKTQTSSTGSRQTSSNHCITP